MYSYTGPQDAYVWIRQLCLLLLVDIAPHHTTKMQMILTFTHLIVWAALYSKEPVKPSPHMVCPYFLCT